MENIVAAFQSLGWKEVIFAACVAYVITYIIRTFQRIRSKKGEKVFVIRGGAADMTRIMERCRELFPIDRIRFDGREFTRGMQVRVKTIQHNIIEGELIGMNKVNLVCIRTQTQIIAQQLEKIEKITAAEESI